MAWLERLRRVLGSSSAEVTGALSKWSWSRLAKKVRHEGDCAFFRLADVSMTPRPGPNLEVDTNIELGTYTIGQVLSWYSSLGSIESRPSNIALFYATLPPPVMAMQPELIHVRPCHANPIPQQRPVSCLPHIRVAISSHSKFPC